MKAVILCAGKGERLRPLTETIPKPMVPINNKPLLEYLILLCKKHGITEIFLNTSYLSEIIRNHFGDGSKWGVKINYFVEKENDLPGTAGVLKRFKKHLNETFFVIYGDNLTNLNLSKMLDFHLSKKSLGTMFVYREPLTNELSTPAIVAVDSNSQIFDLIERPKESDKERLEKIKADERYMNSGIYVLEPKIFNFIPEGKPDFMLDVFPEILKKGDKLFAFRDNPYIREVGIFLRLNKAREEIESGQISLDL